MNTEELLKRLQALPPAERQALMAQLGQADPVLAPKEVGGSMNTGYLTAGGDFAGRDMVKHIVNLYLEAPGAATLDEEEFTKAVGRYLVWVEKNMSWLTWRGLQSGDGQAPPQLLNDVYVSLSASLPTQRRQNQPRHADADGLAEMDDGRETEQIVNMNQLFPQKTQLAIIGGPGSGKTTYLKLIASIIARALNMGDAQPVQEWLGLDGDLPLPIYVSLSDYNVRRRENRRTLIEYINYDYLAEKEIASGLPDDFFTRLLFTGQACCLLLDGLDEIADERERKAVSEAIEKISSNAGISHLIVTSRTRAYVGNARLPFQTATVQPMQPEQVAALAARWCRAVYQAHEAATETSKLQAEIEQLENHRRQRGQKPLIETPLLVTLVAIVHFDRHRLPQQRALLYKECIRLFLAEENKPGQSFTELTDFGGDADEKRNMSATLAYKMMTDGADGQRGAGRKATRTQVEKWLLPGYLQDYEGKEAKKRLAAFLAAMVNRNSLLNERGGEYEFVHLTFQEYLCAYYLVVVKKPGGDEHTARFLLADGRVNLSWWRETILLTIGYRGLEYKGNGLELIKALVNAGDAHSEATLAAAELAVIGFLELESKDSATIQRLQTALQTQLADKELSVKPELRLLAGDALASVGDNRTGVLTLKPDWVSIPAGTFLMGDEKREIKIDTPFAIARYPVTNGQFERFVTDGGYTEKWQNCWTPDGWQYRTENNWQEPRYWDDLKWNRPNQPVVGVSWYEALAFCNWLTHQLRAANELTAQQTVALPTEAEWERAARHTDGRKYPWGEKWRDGIANSKEAGLERTTAVSIFPHNRTEAGVLDMSGNVWEWCQTRWRDEKRKEYPERYDGNDGREELSGDIWRVVKGSAYYSDANALRCAYRVGNYPYNGRDDLGFRVCVRPHFPLSLNSDASDL
ncbi:MAG: SUMF1/EgtB/PvdO family nonheme iron enzyme [Chloroflexi bacterium]|nr:SUMF1/EgtB/PvdO family nonheme iron enzyme [Chloroflexota bacterium]